MAERITFIFEMAAFLGQGYCLYCFLGGFLEDRFSVGRLFSVGDRLFGKRITRFLLPLCWGGMRILCYELSSPGSESMRGVYRLLLQGICLPLFAFCFYRVGKRITVFLLVTFLALSEICFFLSYMIMNLSAPVLEWETELFTAGYIEAAFFESLLRFTAAALQIACCVLWIVLLAVSLRKVVGVFREKAYAMHTTELLFILTPSLVGLLLCVLLRIIMITVENGMPALLYDRYPILQILVPAILLLSLLSIFYSVKLFQDMISLNREKSSRIVLEQQVETLQENTREMERLYAGARSVKHDMKNTLAVLLNLSGKGAMGENIGVSAGRRKSGRSEEDGTEEEFADYLEQLNRSFEKLELRFQTGNAAADALLNMKYHEALQKMPNLEFRADTLLFPEDMAIHSYDISVILGNALDNAAQACLRLRQSDPQAKLFIRLTSFQKGKFFFLEVENSFDGVLRKSAHSELPETLKEEKQMHGIGFSNMRKTAEKYGGGVDYSVAGTESNPEAQRSVSGYPIFTLSVMMKNERRKEDK